MNLVLKIRVVPRRVVGNLPLIHLFFSRWLPPLSGASIALCIFRWFYFLWSSQLFLRSWQVVLHKSDHLLPPVLPETIAPLELLNTSCVMTHETHYAHPTIWQVNPIGMPLLLSFRELGKDQCTLVLTFLWPSIVWVPRWEILWDKHKHPPQKSTLYNVR